MYKYIKKNIKYILIGVLLFSFQQVYANEKYEVTLNKCVDGDTAWFNINGEKVKARFLAIDTPESTNKIEPYGKEASNYTCNILQTSKKIEIEYDEKGKKKDKYDRILVWVYVDDTLLQENILKEGLASVKYLYADYDYTEKLKSAERIAKRKNIGIWKQNENLLFTEENIKILIGIIIAIIGYIFSSKIRKRTNNKIKKNLKRKIDNLI